MALTCNWSTKLITVPKSDLTLVSGTQYSLTVSYWFQLLRELNGGVEGIAQTIGEPLYNNTPPTSSTPRIVDVINGYTVEVEDGLYNLEIINGNTNWKEVEVKNSVGIGTNNTTGFIDPKFLEFGLYNGKITVDVGNITGKAKNVSNIAGELLGVLQNPCDNLSDAASLLDSIGLSEIFVIGDLNISDETSWVRKSFIGDSQNKTLITVDDIADVLNCEFYSSTITGVLDGNSYISNCVITGLDFVDGIIEDSFIGPGVIKLGTSTTANIVGCRSNLPGPNQSAIIDHNEQGILSARDYTGGARSRNYIGTGSHSIDLARGQWIFENTITGGTWVIRGIGKLVDENGDSILSDIDSNGRAIPTSWNGATILNELLNTENISRGLLIYDTTNLP